MVLFVSFSGPNLMCTTLLFVSLWFPVSLKSVLGVLFCGPRGFFSFLFCLGVHASLLEGLLCFFMVNNFDSKEYSWIESNDSKEILT